MATLVIWDRLVSHLYSFGTISLGPSPQLRSSRSYLLSLPWAPWCAGAQLMAASLSLASSLVQTSMAPTAKHCPGPTTSILIPSIAAVEQKGCIYDSSPIFGPGCRELCIWHRLWRKSPPYWCLGGSPGRPTLLPSSPELAPTPPPGASTWR